MELTVQHSHPTADNEIYTEEHVISPDKLTGSDWSSYTSGSYILPPSPPPPPQQQPPPPPAMKSGLIPLHGHPRDLPHQGHMF